MTKAAKPVFATAIKFAHANIFLAEGNHDGCHPAACAESISQTIYLNWLMGL
jgi:hypothetical protein